MLKLLLTIFLSASAAFAQPDCEVTRLSHPDASLMAVLKSALSNGVLTMEDVSAFAHHDQWSDPFAKSSRHLLLPGFATAFATLSAQLSLEQKRAVQDGVLQHLGELAKDRETAQDARAATERILSPVHVYSQSLFPLVLDLKNAFLGTLDGHPALLVAGHDEGQDTPRAVALDPFAQASERVVSLRDTFEITGQQSAKELLREQLPKLIQVGAHQLHFDKPAVHADTKYRDAIYFYNARNELLSQFQIPKGYRFYDDEFPTFYTFGARTFAVVPFKDAVLGGGYAFVVDVTTGREVLKASYASSQANMGLVENGGKIYFYAPEYKKVNGVFVLEMVVTNLEDKSSFSQGEPYHGGVISAFNFHGSAYFLFLHHNTLFVMDAMSGDVITTPTDAKNVIYSISTFEWNGELYAFVLGDVVHFYRLSTRTRGPAMVASSSGGASECGTGPLASAVPSLVAVLKDALQKGALRTWNLHEFLASAEWSNPFRTSQRHLLTPRFNEIFESLAAKLNDDQRRQLKTEVSALLGERAHAETVRVEAKAATEHVLSPALVAEIPLHPMTSSQEMVFEGRIDGRPGFLMAAYDMAARQQVALTVDPFAPESERLKRLENFPFAADVLMSTSIRKGLPRVGNEHGHHFEFQSPALSAGTSGSRLLTFRGEDGKPVSNFPLGELDVMPTDQATRFFTFGARRLAVVQCYHPGPDYKRFTYIVNVENGRPILHFEVTQDTSAAGLLQISGKIYAFAAKNEEAAADRAEIQFVNIDDQSDKFTRKGPDLESRPVAGFTLGDQPFLAWANGDGLVIQDVASETELHLPLSMSRIYALQTFEYQGDLYAYAHGEITYVFRLTSVTRRGTR